ncbi:hypothetical protein DSCW_21740 [Desulfosarcina widdelii]|uniref:Uncharacterized protein n=1 Tax=Desulfosarcina widdelii TaxID=947919 RepID=A0A5K7ZEZ8_9BACT|nr:hypothetical protein [Desulfosarcina widdelii]BBO74757.1 hypothetical protein DSCW_21740 [Desulfosarcina widdelii]
MAYTRELFPKLNFVYTLATGTLDDQPLMIHLMSFYAESEDYEVIRELLDTRGLQNVEGLTVRGMIRAAETQKKLFPGRDFRAAVIVNSAEYRKGVEIYSSLANTKKLQIKPFENGLDEPLVWLGYNKENRIKIKRFISRHTPLRQQHHPIPVEV